MFDGDDTLWDWPPGTVVARLAVPSSLSHYLSGLVSTSYRVYSLGRVSELGSRCGTIPRVRWTGSVTHADFGFGLGRMGVCTGSIALDCGAAVAVGLSVAVPAPTPKSLDLQTLDLVVKSGLELLLSLDSCDVKETQPLKFIQDVKGLGHIIQCQNSMF